MTYCRRGKRCVYNKAFITTDCYHGGCLVGGGLLGGGGNGGDLAELVAVKCQLVHASLVSFSNFLQFYLCIHTCLKAIWNFYCSASISLSSCYY